MSFFKESLKPKLEKFFAKKDHSHSDYVTKEQGNESANKNVVTDANGNITTENKPTIDSSLSSSSTNAVQNKVINTALGDKVDKETGKGLSTNDYTTTEKNKLAGIATEANKTTVDSSMSSNSTNPVQNKVVNSAIATKTVTVEKQATAESGYTATYVVKQNGAQVGEKINIPKDFLVKSASVNTVGASGAQTASQLGTGYSTGDKYIDFVINTKDNSGTDEHIYVNVKDLVDTYTAATQSTAGLMSAADKQKLDGMASGGGTATDHNHDGSYIKTGTGTVTSTNIADGTIVNGDIANTTIQGGKLVNGTITATQLASNAVETAKIKDANVTNAKLADQTNTVTEYIVGTQASSTAAWTGTSTKISSLQAGQVIYYKLPYASANRQNVTLNLTLADGTTTGAKEVWFWNGNRLTTHYDINSVIGLVYNGSQWWVINPSTNNSNNVLNGANYFTTGEALTTNNLIACKKADGKYYKINTLKGLVIDISKPVLITNGSLNADQKTANSIIYHPWVSPTNLNGGTTLNLSSTTYQPVYLEGTGYSNGEFTVSTTPITQTLTNGRFYIMLGVAYTTNGMGIDLTNQQVLYCYNNTLIPSTSWNAITNKPSSFTPASHTHSYLPLSGGTLTGAVSSNSNIITSGHLTQSSDYNSTSGATGNIPVAGLLSTSDSITTYLPKIKSYIGAINFTASGDTSYTNVISTRYRNGSSDGNAYGMYLKSKMQNNNQNLIWNRQYSSSGWQGERVILDSSNYSTYAATSGHNHDGTYLKSYTPPTASTSQAGIVQLSDSTSTTSSTVAATSTAVKAAYDKGNHSHPYISTTAGSVGASNLASNAVETTKIKDNAVTISKFGTHEFINGTQTTSTSAWTGKSTRISSLVKGVTIYYRLPYASTSTGVTLNLTLADGTTTTGAKNVYFTSGQVTTHYAQYSVIALVYDGTNWMCLSPYVNSNTYDRNIYAANITAGEALANGNLAYAKSDGKYYKITANGALNINYPILYIAEAITSGAEGKYNNYNIISSINLQSTISGKTVTANKRIYLEGSSLNKSTFTISSNVFVAEGSFTNNNYYIPLGVSHSTTNIRFNSFEGKIVYKYTTANGLVPVGYSYNDLLDKPTIPTAVTVENNLTSDSTTNALSAAQGKALKTAVDGKQAAGSYATASHTHDYSSTYAAKSHTHASGDVTGLTASQNVVTGTDGKLTTEAKNNHTHGNISSTGTVTASDTTATFSNFLATNNEGSTIKRAQKLKSSAVVDTTLGENQDTINSNVSTSLGTKIDTAGTGMTKSGTTLGVKNSVRKQNFTKNGVTVEVYSDDLYVTVKLSGAIAKNTSGYTDLDSGNTTITSTYRPVVDTYAPIHAGSTNFKIILRGSGKIRIYHSTSASTDVYGLITYPLASRLTTS